MNGSESTDDERRAMAARCAHRFLREGMEAVEVGVMLGNHAATLLARNPGRLHLVDTWSFERGATRMAPGMSGEDAFLAVRERFAGDERVRIHRRRSVDAAAQFAEQSLDFVYIDANHAFHEVVRDLAAWFPRVRIGGILSGHDYLLAGSDRTYAVHLAVDRFWQGSERVEPLAFSNDWVLRRVG